MSTSLKIICTLLLVGILVSLFLPFYETFQYAYLPFEGIEISSRPNPDQGGFFGGGFYTTFNGFGSIYALFNTVISGILVSAVISGNNFRSLWRVLCLLFIGSLLWLVFLNCCVHPSLLSPSDNQLTGFFLLTGCEIALFIVTHKLSKLS
jgi:hypothetical protein